MSKFDLRDISTRLTKSRDIQSVIFEFLHCLEAARPDWRASIAFHEANADGFEDVFETEGERVVRRHIVVPSNQLPDRLVRKLFDASAIYNAAEKRSLFSGGLGTAPYYVADERDASELMPLTVISDWKSCVCMPLGDQSDLIGILVVTSLKKNAFGGRAVGEILPVKSLVTVAMMKHLQRTQRLAAPPPAVRKAEAVTEAASEAAEEVRAQLEVLARKSRELEAEERAEREAQESSNGEALANLTSEYEARRRSSEQYKEELERVRSMMELFEAQAIAATEHLSDTYTEMNTASWEMADLERRLEFARRLLALLGGESDERRLPTLVVAWLCKEFGIERCSMMTLDESRETLQISAQCGLDPGVAATVRVRMGQGVAGWVAYNRKPLLVRMRSQADITPEDQSGTYNSPSFIAVPMVHNGRLYGVINLSNKDGGELFTGVDFDCASIAGAVLALRLSSCEPAQGTLARAA